MTTDALVADLRQLGADAAVAVSKALSGYHAKAKEAIEKGHHGRLQALREDLTQRISTLMAEAKVAGDIRRVKEDVINAVRAAHEKFMEHASMTPTK